MAVNLTGVLFLYKPPKYFASKSQTGKPKPQGEVGASSSTTVVPWTHKDLDACIRELPHMEIDRQWYQWVVELAGGKRTYGACISIIIDHIHHESYAIAPSYDTRVQAFDAVARLAQRKGLAALLLKTYPAPTGPAAAAPRHPRNLKEFTSRLNLPPVLDSITPRALQWMQDAAKLSNFSFDIAVLEPTGPGNRYGAVLSIVEKTTTGPAVEMSWVVRYLTNKIDTITAVCYLALSSGFPGAMRQPIVFIPADHSSPKTVRPWNWPRGCTKAIPDPIGREDLGPKCKKLWRRCRKASNGWPSWTVLTPGGQNGDANRVFLDLYVGAVVTAGYYHEGEPGATLVETMEDLATIVLKDLRRAPAFFTANSAVGGVISPISPASRTDLKGKPWPMTLDVIHGWLTSIPRIERMTSRLYNGILSDSKIGFNKGQIKPSEALELVAGGYGAEVMFVDIVEDAVGKKPIRYGCALVVHFRTLLAPLYFHVTCSYGGVGDARHGVAYQAIYAGCVEAKLYSHREDFKRLHWTEEKFSYMEDQGGLLDRLCKDHGLSPPTFEVEEMAALGECEQTYQCTVTLNLVDRRITYSTSDLCNSAEVAKMEGLLVARREGIMEAIDPLPTQYFYWSSEESRLESAQDDA